MLGVIEKADEDVLDYDVEFADWLTDGDTLLGADSTIEGSTVSPSSLTVDRTDVTDDRVKVWLSGGSAGESALLKIVINTTGGRVKERTYRVRVKER